MGCIVATSKILFKCDNQTVVDIWQKGSTKIPEIMALVRVLYFRAAHYNINICIQHITATVKKLLMLYPASRKPDSKNWLQKPRQHQTTSLRGHQKSSLSPHVIPPSWYRRINPLPATPLTLQYFCADKSHSTSYKTLKVYLAAIP